jgi:hypothetical protein
VMSATREIRWKIDAAYTADTMPLDRLADYLKHLAGMLGEAQHLHLIKMENASANAVFRVDVQSIERVRQRGSEVRRGTAPLEAMESYRAINAMLQEDRGKATLYEGDAEIIPFPGMGELAAEPQALVVPSVQQQGHLDGQLIKVGGEKPWVPVQLVPLGGEKITGCYAKKALAKKMGSHLFEPVRLYGRGKWRRTDRGNWEVDKFWIDEFDTLSTESLPSVVAALRNVKTEWHKTPIADIIKDENE